ncbi:MAG: hypothetical protein ACRCX5_06460, partial [Bacteroidales bacterium]
KYRGDYYVVRPPRGACIDEIPYWAQRKYQGGKLVFQYGDIYFELRKDGWGKDRYEVMGSSRGDRWDDWDGFKFSRDRDDDDDWDD